MKCRKLSWEEKLSLGCADAAEQQAAWAELNRLESIVDKLQKTCLTAAGDLAALVDGQTGPLRGDLENIRLTLRLAAEAAKRSD